MEFSSAQVEFNLSHHKWYAHIDLLTAVEGELSWANIFQVIKTSYSRRPQVHWKIPKRWFDLQVHCQIFFAKIPQRSQKKFVCTDSATGITRAALTMHITFASTGIIVKNQRLWQIILCGVKCTTCPTCNQTCRDFVKERCNRLDKAPYVCNGCPKAINRCSIAHKYRYDAILLIANTKNVFHNPEPV